MAGRGHPRGQAQDCNRSENARVEKQAPIAGVSYLPENFEPTPWTVLCGRGRRCYDNYGNRRFRLLIAIYLPRYIGAKRRRDKSAVVTEIVDTIRTGSGHRGGFVKYDEANRRWFEVERDVAREKVGCEFRVALSAGGDKTKESAWEPIPNMPVSTRPSPSLKDKRRTNQTVCSASSSSPSQILKSSMAEANQDGVLYAEFDNSPSSPDPKEPNDQELEPISLNAVISDDFDKDLHFLIVGSELDGSATDNHASGYAVGV